MIVEKSLTPTFGLRASELIKFITVNESVVTKVSEVNLLESCRTTL